MIYSGAYGSAAYGGITGVTVTVVVQTRTGQAAAILVTTPYPQVGLLQVAPGPLALSQVGGAAVPLRSTGAGNPLPLVSARHDTIPL